jgi:alkylated DNA repair dioxygenase AlkB
MMNLFTTDTKVNLLPYDGEVIYYGYILSDPEANDYLNTLLETIAWKHDEAIIYGKHIITKRMVAWYGNNMYSYTYSNTTKQANIWTKELLALKILVEQYTGTVYNSCLLNLYHNGSEGMGWHSDDEKSLGKDSSIASLSLGAERKFALKHRASKQSTAIMLKHGSLLEMKGTTQTNWLHSLPKTTKITAPRINLTFRTMVQ